MTHCAAFKPMRVSVPKPDKDGNALTLSFKAEHKKTHIPIVIYADSEAINHEINEVTPSGKTERSSEHRCVSIRARVESKVSGFESFSFQCTGDDAADQFVSKLYELRPTLTEQYTKNMPMEMTEKDSEAHAKAEVCCECKKEFGTCNNKRKVRHHDHKNGKYIGAAHADCNLRMGIRQADMPVFFHNGKGYDNHFIIQAISRLEDIENVKISVIPDNSEKYKMVNFRGYRFLDSISFLNSWLGSLASNLIGHDPKNAPRFHKAFAEKGLSEQDLLRVTRKGVFPYKWFDSVAKLDHTVLPSRGGFFNDLSGEECTTQYYTQAQWVWERFGCKTFRDYHDLYPEADVLLLADVFEAFRDLCMQQYGLDPAHYITLPGMCIDGAVLEAAKKDIKVQLIHTDPDKYTFVERGIRGGVSVVSHRYAKANIQGTADYDPRRPNSSIMYLDANNLYGWAMMQYLPCGDFNWSDISLDQVLSGQWDGDKGCSVEVDLEYPKELHDNHNDLPLAPERLSLGYDDASGHAQKLTEDSTTSCEKLAGHFRPHLNYVCDARLLQYYVSKGLRVTKLHRAMTYTQAQTLKPWIEKNTALRAAAKNAFEKDFFKLCNNSVFGKTMQNVRAETCYEFFTNDDKLKKRVADARFERCTVLGNIACVSRIKDDVIMLNKPIFMGAAILDLSKLLMFRFQYDVIHAKYGAKAKLLFTDTDSLCYHIETADVYADMGQMVEHFDTSDYPQDHTLYSTANKKVVGKFKDETNSYPIQEFVGLKSKMYCFTVGSTTKRTEKGIKKTVAKRDLKMEQYKAALGGEACTVKQTMIQSRNHRICTVSTECPKRVRRQAVDL